MEMKLEKMLEKLIITGPVELSKESIENQTIEVNKITSFVFDHIAQIQNEKMIQYLTQVIAQACLQKKFLIDVVNQFNSLDTSESSLAKRILLKKNSY